MPARLYEIGSPAASALIQALKLTRPVLFVGSAVSMWEPSGMPTGQDFTLSLYDALFGEDFPLEGEEETVLRRLFGDMPFEHLMEVCPDSGAASALVADLYGKSEPNPIHVALARALRRGLVESLVTTNYDCCVEAAAGREQGRPLRKVVTEGDLAGPEGPSDAAWYFKIHGSIEPGLEHTAVRTMAEESLLPSWKRRLLRTLLEGKTVVFLGYSGRDFELCPEIARIPLARMVWVNREPAAPSVNAEALIEEAGGELLYGDMNDLLGEWLGAERAMLTADRLIVGRAVGRHVSRDALRAWRVAVLNRMGAPRLALRALDLPGGGPAPLAVRRLRAHAEVGAGKYLSAARHFLSDAAGELRARGRCEAADVLLDACDSYRIAGALVRAWACYAAARLLACGRNRAKVYLKLSLLLHAVRGFTPGGAAGPIRRPLRRLLAGSLRRCARAALSTGNWLDFQQAGLIARRAQIPLGELAEGDFYPPPDPRRGYRQLGYYLAYSMTFLDELVERDSGDVPDGERRAFREALETHLRYCALLGISPQSWKLRAAGLWCLTLDTEGARAFAASMVEEFRDCEYRPVMRRYWRRRFPRLNSALADGLRRRAFGRAPRGV